MDAQAIAQAPVSRKRGRAVAPLPCAERRHYSAEHLATNAARMIALSCRDPEPMLAVECACGDGWRMTHEGTGVEAWEKPSRASRADRQAAHTAERAERLAKLAGTWSS